MEIKICLASKLFRNEPTKWEDLVNCLGEDYCKALLIKKGDEAIINFNGDINSIEGMEELFFRMCWTGYKPAIVPSQNMVLLSDTFKKEKINPDDLYSSEYFKSKGKLHYKNYPHVHFFN